MGSEMCIRDRILEDDTYALTRSAVRLRNRVLETHTIAQTKRRALAHTQKKQNGKRLLFRGDMND